MTPAQLQYVLELLEGQDTQEVLAYAEEVLRGLRRALKCDYSGLQLSATCVKHSERRGRPACHCCQLKRCPRFRFQMLLLFSGVWTEL
jgi:hypothetical protein